MDLMANETGRTEDQEIYCDCGAVLTDEEIDHSGAECTRCFAQSHFTCADCNEEVENEERSKSYTLRCQGCQQIKEEAELAERVDALVGEAQELLDSISSDGDVAVLKRAVAALRRLAKK